MTLLGKRLSTSRKKKYIQMYLSKHILLISRLDITNTNPKYLNVLFFSREKHFTSLEFIPGKFKQLCMKCVPNFIVNQITIIYFSSMNIISMFTSTHIFFLILGFRISIQYWYIDGKYRIYVARLRNG